MNNMERSRNLECVIRDVQYVCDLFSLLVLTIVPGRWLVNFVL